MDVATMQQLGVCSLDVVHLLKEEELRERKFGVEKRGYIENAFNTESVLGLSKEMLEARNLDDEWAVSPGLSALLSRYPEQAPPGEHRQHNENVLVSGIPCVLQTLCFMPPRSTPMVVKFVTALEEENKLIRTSWVVLSSERTDMALLNIQGFS